MQHGRIHLWPRLMRAWVRWARASLRRRASRRRLTPCRCVLCACHCLALSCPSSRRYRTLPGHPRRAAPRIVRASVHSSWVVRRTAASTHLQDGLHFSILLVHIGVRCDSTCEIGQSHTESRCTYRKHKQAGMRAISLEGDGMYYLERLGGGVPSRYFLDSLPAGLPAGQPGTCQGPWFDSWAAALHTRFTAWFSYFKAIGGQVDYVSAPCAPRHNGKAYRLPVSSIASLAYPSSQFRSCDSIHPTRRLRAMVA